MQLDVSGYVLLCFMAVMDFIAMFCQVFFALLPVFSPINQHNFEWLCYAFIVLRFTSTKSTSLMFVCMSAERIIAVYFPIHYRQKINVRIMLLVGIRDEKTYSYCKTKFSLLELINLRRKHCQATLYLRTAKDHSSDDLEYIFLEY